MHFLVGVRGTSGYLDILAVAIARFKSLDKKIRNCYGREK